METFIRPGPSDPYPGMNVDAVLLNVQERDKWQRRLRLLKQSLLEVRSRRARWQGRLRRIDAEIRRLAEYADALVDQMPGANRGRSDGAANRSVLPR